MAREHDFSLETLLNIDFLDYEESKFQAGSHQSSLDKKNGTIINRLQPIND